MIAWDRRGNLIGFTTFRVGKLIRTALASMIFTCVCALLPRCAMAEGIDTEHIFGAAGSTGSLDLVNFERRQARLVFGVSL